jgi:hypothetical protein
MKILQPDFQQNEMSEAGKTGLSITRLLCPSMTLDMAIRIMWHSADCVPLSTRYKIDNLGGSQSSG